MGIWDVSDAPHSWIILIPHLAHVDRCICVIICAQTHSSFALESSFQFTLEDTLSVEYMQPGVDVLNRDNVAVMVRLAPKSAAAKNESKKKKRRDEEGCCSGSCNSSSSSSREEHLVVATTHLLYNPNRMDVKLAQSVVLMAGEGELFRRPVSQ